MKITFRLILAILAAAVALTACTKEITPNFENDKVNPEGSRVIAVSFGPQTKTRLDGLQPKFVDNDSILISNGVAIDTCDVEVEGNVATISTNLTGPLTAVYPYTAAGMNSDKPTQIDTVIVSTEQSGKFADANICMAKMTSENDESLSFENKTAVFCITPGAGADTKYVEVSAKDFNIANDVLTGSEFKNYDKIHVATTTADSVYVSILVPEGLKVSDLSFSDGVNEKTVATGARADEIIAAGTLYTVTNENWKSPEADTPEGAIKGVFTVSAGPDGEAGTADDIKVHFSQGNLYCSRTSSETNDWTWHFYGKQYQFNSIPTTDGKRTAQTSDTEIDLFTWGYSESTSLLPAGNTYVTAHTTTEDKQLVYNTDSGDDWGVAYCNSNNIAVGTWRTLTTAEWQYLVNTRAFNNGTNTGEGYSYQRAKINSDATGVYGMILYPDNYTGTAQTSYTSAEWVSLENAGCVFLPAAGYRYSSDVDSVGVSGSYWSSTARGEYFAYDVYFPSGDVYPDYYAGRNLGFSVRLVTDVSAALEDGTRGSINGHDFVVVAGVKWATQNIAVTESGKKSWKGQNDDNNPVKVPGPNSDENIMVGDYFQWATYEEFCGSATDVDKGLLIYTSFSHQYCVGDETTGIGGWKGDKRFIENDGPYRNNSLPSKFDKYQGSKGEDSRTVLEPENDVAHILWGATWRMPTKEELLELCRACFIRWDDVSQGMIFYQPKEEAHMGMLKLSNSQKILQKGATSYSNYSGSDFPDVENYTPDDALLFFPASGMNRETGFENGSGNYLSSCLYSTAPWNAYSFQFGKNFFQAQSFTIFRFIGCSIRPVSD